MKKIVISLLTLAASTSAHAWLCTAQSPNGAFGQGLSLNLYIAQQTALNYCFQSGGFNCIVVACR